MYQFPGAVGLLTYKDMNRDKNIGVYHQGAFHSQVHIPDLIAISDNLYCKQDPVRMQVNVEMVSLTMEKIRALCCALARGPSNAISSRGS